MWVVLCVYVGGGRELHSRFAFVFVTRTEEVQPLYDGFNNKSTEQEAESQRIVGQSLLSRLQYPVPYQSRLQRIYLSQRLELR